MSIWRGTCLCFTAVCFFALLSCEVEAKSKGKSFMKSAAKSYVGRRYRPGGYHGGGTYSRGLVDEDLPWWKLLLIIIAICLMVLGIMLLCHCAREGQQPDERQAKVTEFLEHQEAQRMANFPVAPPPLPYPVYPTNGAFFPSAPAEPISSTTALLSPDTAAASQAIGAKAPHPIGFYIPP